MFNLDAVAILSILTVAGSIVMLVTLGLRVRAKIFSTHTPASEVEHE